MNCDDVAEAGGIAGKRDTRRPYGPGRAWRRLLLLVAAVAPLLVACVVGVGTDPRPPEPVPAPEPGELRTVPLRVLEAGGSTLALVPVTISGQGPYLFALDTGASNTVLDTSIADQLGLSRTGEKRDISGVVARESVELARVEQWQLGDFELGAGEIALLDLPSPMQGGEGLQGLLGSDVLSDFDYVVIDYDDGRLGLAPE
jgi:predicted aspartyl protease